jgi:hypothetical protein
MRGMREMSSIVAVTEVQNGRTDAPQVSHVRHASLIR